MVFVTLSKTKMEIGDLSKVNITVGRTCIQVLLTRTLKIFKISSIDRGKIKTQKNKKILFRTR